MTQTPEGMVESSMKYCFPDAHMKRGLIRSLRVANLNNQVIAHNVNIPLNHIRIQLY